MPQEIAPGITVDDDVRFGRPVVAGTRVPVALIIGQLAGGMTPDEVAEEYGITVQAVRQALAYAAEVVDTELVKLRP